MGKNHWLGTILCVALVSLDGCRAPAAIDAGDIPAPLRVPPNATLTQRMHADGVQIYQCTPAKGDAARFEWLLKAPEAALFDHSGKQIGKHFAGPTWEARDGSNVVGEVAARATPDPGAIAWLLLNAKSTSGSGVFSTVRYVQRLRTVGGNAPAGGCDQAAAGSEVRVPYSAEYWFYAEKS
jgi:Protein of unknown function (DUF3455)